MSIINDALKKVQNDIEQKKFRPKSLPVPARPAGGRQAGPAPSKPKPSEPQKHTPPRPSLRDTATENSLPRKDQLPARAPVIPPILVTTLFAAFILAFFLSAEKPIQITQTETASPLPVAPIPDEPAEAVPEEAEITLNGIMSAGDKNVALINDEIYEIGDTVNEMKIIEISLDSVQMLKKGKTKTFQVTSK